MRHVTQTYTNATSAMQPMGAGLLPRLIVLLCVFAAFTVPGVFAQNIAPVANSEGLLDVATFDGTTPLPDSLEFDTGQGKIPHMVKVAGNTYAIVYAGSGDDGWVVTVTVQPDGTVGNAVLDSFEFDTAQGEAPKIINVTGDIFAIAYSGNGNDGWLKTMQIQQDGTIGAVLSSLEFDTAQGETPEIINVTGDIFAIAYSGNGDDGWLKTMQIQADGTIGAVLDSLEFDTDKGKEPEIINVAGDIFAVAYQGNGDDGWLKTMQIQADGTIGAVIDSLEFDTSQGKLPEIVNVAGDIFAIPYQGSGDDGWLKTMQIQANGTIGAIIDSLEFDTAQGKAPSIVSLYADYFAIPYQGVGDDGWIKTLQILANGTIGAVIDSLEFDTAQGKSPFLLPIGGVMFGVVYEGNGSDGFVSTVHIDYPDRSLYTTYQDTLLTVTAANGVLANDTDPNGDALTAVKDTDPANGTLSAFNTDGSFTYTPNAGFIGTDTFTYHADDGAANSNTVTVTINVIANPNAPYANPDGLLDVATFNGTPDFLEFDTGTGLNPHIVKVSEDVYAIAYEGPGGDGFIKTVTIGNDGLVGAAAIDTLEFDTGDCDDPFIIHVVGTYYAIAYNGPGGDGWIKTVDIAADGTIANAVVDSLEFNTNTGQRPSMVQVDADMVAIAYTGNGTDGFVVTVQIAADGTMGASVTDSLEFDTSNSFEPSIVNVAGDIFAIAYRDNGAGDDGWLATVDIDGAGTISAVIDRLEFDTANAYEPNMIQVSGEYFAIAYRGPDNDGWLATVQIAAAGTMTAVDSFEFDTAYAQEPSMTKVFGDYFAIAYSDADPGDGWIDTVEISTTGVITPAVIDSLEFDTGQGDDPWLLQVGGAIFGIAYAGGGTDGFVRTVHIEFPDRSLYTTNEDTLLTVTVANGVLANDTDPNGDAITAVLVAGVSNGTLNLNADGSFTYDPNLNFNGTDTFTYKPNDGGLDGNTVTVTITINPVNDAPVVNLDPGNASGGPDDGNFPSTFVEYSGAVNITESSTADVTDVDDTTLPTLDLTWAAVLDAASETITIGGTTFTQGTSDTQVVTVGATNFNIVYTSGGGGGTFAITEDGGGEMPLADMNALIRGITYNNSANPPNTGGTRTVQFVANDGDDNSNTATATITVNAVDTDGDLTVAGGVIEPVDVSSIADTPGERVAVLDFTISDGGTSDGLSLKVSQIVLNTGGTGTFGDLTWEMAGPDITGYVTGAVGGGTITFSSLTIDVPDGLSEVYTVYAYFSATPPTSTDNQTFNLSVDGDTDLTLGSPGSRMGATTAVTTGGDFKMDVIHTKLIFTTQPPASAVVNSDFAGSLGISGTDVNDNIDVDFAEPITISAVKDVDKSPGSGTLSSTDGGGLTQPTVGTGTATWTDTRYDTIEVIDIAATSASYGAVYSTAVTLTFDSDGDLTGTPGAVGISSIANTQGARIAVFVFTLTDGGTSDLAAMGVTQIVFNTSGTGTFSDLTWELTGPDIPTQVAGVVDVGANTITFSALPISIADSTSDAYTVHAYFSTSPTSTDNQTFILSVDGDTDVTVSATGTLMGSTTPVDNSGGPATMDVVHTQLTFTAQPPSGATVGADFSGQITLTAQDINGNVDADFVEAITLSAVKDVDKSPASGTLASTDTGGLTKTAASGVATWTNTTYDTVEVIDIERVSASYTGIFSTAVDVDANTPVGETFTGDDDPPWWDTVYAKRVLIHVRNDAASDLPQGYTLSLPFNHAGLVDLGESLASGDDIRLVYYNRTLKQNLELDRVAATAWNGSGTELRYRLQNRVVTGQELRDYFLYWNNPASGAPPIDENNIYLMYDAMAVDLSKWDTANDVGTWTLASGLLDSADSGGTHYFIDQNYIEGLTDYILEWDAEAVTGGTTRNFYHTLRVNPADPQERIVVGGDLDAGQWEIVRWRTTMTADAPLATSAEAISADTIYSMKTQLQGNTITFSVNGTQKLSYTMSGSDLDITWNNIAGFANDDSHARFDNFRLRHLISSAPVVQFEEPWRPGLYNYRCQITVDNTGGPEAAIVGYSVRADIPHAVWVAANKSQADGDDIRVLYWDGSSYTELPRHNSTAWGGATTRIYFPLQVAIAAGDTSTDYYIYSANASAKAPPNDPEDVYIWFDDFSSNTVRTSGDSYANSLLSSSGTITEAVKAIGTIQTETADMSADAVLTLDMGEGEEVIDGTGDDFTVYLENGGGADDYTVYGANLELGPWTQIGTASDTASFDLNGAGLSEARYIRIVAGNADTPQIDAVQTINRNSDVVTGRYNNGKHVDIHGEIISIMNYDSTRQVATMDQGDNHTGGLRITTIDITNVLVQVDENVFRVYDNNGTTAFLVRWTSLTNNFYAHLSNGYYKPATGARSPAIARGDNVVERNWDIAGDSGPNIFFPSSEIDVAATDTAADGDGIYDQRSDTTTNGGLTGIDTIRYGIYQVDATNSSHRFWVNNDTELAASVENTLYADSGDFPSGQVAINPAQQWGFFDNYLIREYIDPEPSITMPPTDTPIADFKVTGVHPFTTAVAPGVQNVQILRLDIETGVSGTLTKFVVRSKNDDDADVTGVSAYYTGTSAVFSTSTPFGIEDQTFASLDVTFTGSQPLPASSLVHVFIVYDIDANATLGDDLDAKIEATEVTIGGTDYPSSSIEIDPAGERTIRLAQTLDSIVPSNVVVTTVKPGTSNAQILRLDFAVLSPAPPHSPLSLDSIKVTSTNSDTTDSDVTGVSAYYTTTTVFSTATPFGTENQPFIGNEVTFAGFQSLGDGAAAGTFYIFIVYNVSATAILGNTLDAKILASDIVVQGVTRTAVPADPGGSRTIAVPTGVYTGLPPISILMDSDPGIPIPYWDVFNETDGGDADLWVDDLETDNGVYAGGTMDRGAQTGQSTFDPQMIAMDFVFDLDDPGVVPGIEGSDINSLIFRAEMFLTGTAGGGAPATNPADWDKITDANVQLYDWTKATWETLGPDFLQGASSAWNATTEASNWDADADTHDEKPLVRSKFAGFTNDHLNSSGYLKIRVQVDGALLNATADSNMVFDYAWIDFNYGANMEQVSWRWADDAELSVADENKKFTAATSQDLHLRVSIRDRYRQFANHRLALQYDTDASFTNASVPGSEDDFIISPTSGTPLLMFVNGKKDVSLNGAWLLADTDSDEFYHEDNIPQSHTKEIAKIYEADFAVNTTTSAGTYYLRLVRVDGLGDYLGLLDVYTNTISLDVAAPTLTQTGFHWAANVAGPTFDADDAAKEFVVGDDYILGVQIDNTGADANLNWRLQYQKTNSGGGTWTNVTTTSADWRAIDGLYGADDIASDTAKYMAYAGAGAQAAGKYSEVGVSSSPSTTFLITGSEYAEIWYSIEAQSAATGNAYRFRVIQDGDPSSISASVYAVAQQTVYEMESFRIADEGQSPLAAENASLQVATNDKLHIHVGVRSNNNTWTGHYLAIQYDTVSNFSNADAAQDTYILKPGSAPPAQMWDDADHTNEGTLTATILSDTPTAGRYHEDNDLASSEAAMSKDELVEHDFTVEFDTAGTYYLRLVEVDSGGLFLRKLDSYTETATIAVIDPTMRQNFYRWAPDAAPPTFSASDDTPQELDPGIKYILAFQMENTGVLASAGSWQVQYRKTNGGGGSWTSITTGTSEWKATDGIYGNGGKVITATGDFACNSGNPPGGTPTAVDGVYSETGAITMSLGATSYTELWFAVEPDINATHNRYEFRLTKAGNAGPFVYTVLAVAHDTFYELASYRWASADELAVANENSGYQAVIGAQLHLRIGIRSNYTSWDTAAHNLALQFADDINFTTNVTLLDSNPAENMFFWDDAPQNHGDSMSATNLLSGSPADEKYYESNTVQAGTTKTADTVYEADFTVELRNNVAAVGAYFLRVVEVDGAGAFLRVLGEYTNIVQLDIRPLNNTVEAWDWDNDAAAPVAWKDTTQVQHQLAGIFIVTARVKHEDPDTDSTWQLQYQEEPNSPDPGSWITITTTSTDWQMNAAAVYKANQGTVDQVTEFGTLPFAGTKTDGVFSKDNDGVNDTLAGDPIYTEYQFAITPTASASGKEHRFRLTNGGSEFGFKYDEYLFALHGYMLTTAVTGNGSLSLPPPGQFIRHGTDTAVTPTPDSGYLQYKWELDGIRLVDGFGSSTLGAYTITNITAIHTLEAFFMDRFLDSDNDGLPNYWERIHYDDIDEATQSNTDGDLWLAIDEYLFGTSPRNAAVPPVLYVDDDGSHLSADGTSGNPYKFLQSTMTLAAGGTVIIVRPGVYNLDGFVLNKNLYLIGDDPRTTFIKGPLTNAGGLTGQMIEIGTNASYFLMDGFTIRRYRSPAPVISYSVGTGPEIVSFRNTIFTENTTGAYPLLDPIGVQSTLLIYMYNCLVYGNSGSAGHALELQGKNLTFIHNTIADNTLGGVKLTGSGDSLIRNCIIRDNTGTDLDDQSSGTLTKENTNVEGAGDAFDLVETFIDSANGNYRLVPTSAGVDAGNPDWMFNDFVDVTRPLGGTPDLGYDESDPNDFDNDGLSNAVETDTGTFIDNTDTGSDPLDPDSDDDNLRDGPEVNTWSTDPNTADHDGDGMIDGDEVNAGQKPTVDDLIPLTGTWVVDFEAPTFTLVSPPSDPLTDFSPNQVSREPVVIQATTVYEGTQALEMSGAVPESIVYGHQTFLGLSQIYVDMWIKQPRAPLPSNVRQAFHVAGANFALDNSGNLAAYDGTEENWLVDTTAEPDDWFRVWVHRTFSDGKYDIWINERLVYTEIPIYGEEATGMVRFTSSSVDELDVQIDRLYGTEFPPFNSVMFDAITSTSGSPAPDITVTLRDNPLAARTETSTMDWTAFGVDAGDSSEYQIDTGTLTYTVTGEHTITQNIDLNTTAIGALNSGDTVIKIYLSNPDNCSRRRDKLHTFTYIP